MPITPQQVVPWAAAFVGGTAASWLAYKLAPTRYRDFLGGLGLLGGGALSYDLANKYLAPAERPAVSSGEPPTEPAVNPIATEPETSAEELDKKVTNAENPNSALANLPVKADARALNPSYAPHTVPWINPELSLKTAITRPFVAGPLRGLQDAWNESHTLVDSPFVKIPDIGIKTLSRVNGLVELGDSGISTIRKLKNPAGHTGIRGRLDKYNKVGKILDIAHTFANTYNDIRKGLEPNYYGEQAIARREEFDRNTGGNTDAVEAFAYMTARNVTDKVFRNFLAGMALSPKVKTSGTISALELPATITLGTPVAAAKEWWTTMLNRAKDKETGIAGQVLANTLYEPQKKKITDPESLLHETKRILKGTWRLFTGGFYGKEAYAYKHPLEQLAERPIRDKIFTEAKKRYTDEFLAKHPEIAADYASTDGVRRLRAIRAVNKEIGGKLREKFSGNW